MLGRYEQLCEERVQRAVREVTDTLAREQSELRERVVQETVEEGIRQKEEAIREAWRERGLALEASEREVRDEMEEKADRMVSEEREKGEQRFGSYQIIYFITNPNKYYFLHFNGCNLECKKHWRDLKRYGERNCW